MLVVQTLISLAILTLTVLALVSAFRLVPHRRDDLTPTQLWLSGWRFYSRASFKASGHPLQRRFFRVLGAIVTLMIVRTLLALFIMS